MEILKLVCLFLGVFFTIVNTLKIIANSGIHAAWIILQALGITGFIYFQWLR